ncbi:MAG: class I SAM-dependent methyltransferase [Candidatus Nezhaarchaeales archaeon]|nr:MAG: SAM-dependent methyltransferase [Candidatus Nezhaarchaeota archaeon WYZ-LMO7]
MPRTTIYFPTPEEVVEKMLEMTNASKNDVLYDLGCGDGRVLILAAKKVGLKCVGIEVRKELVEQAREKIVRGGLQDLVVIHHGDMFQFDVSEATIVYLYLTTDLNLQLKPKLEKELRRGTRVVSHQFEVPGWKPMRVEGVADFFGQPHRLYLYII